MFQCTECSKDFNSQSSLTRHFQNHSQSIRHVCNVCSVIFRRRDLLTRHLKLHDEDNNENNSDDVGVDIQLTSEHHDGPGEAVVTAHSRKRCHTACNRCRDLKIKCNGHCPCSRCDRAGKACNFDRPLRTSGRISQLHSTAVVRPPSSRTTNLVPGPKGLGCHAENAFPMSMPGFSPTSETDAIPSPGHIPDSTSTDHGGEYVASDFGVPSLPWDVFFDQITPWPWLHESLFLSGGESGIIGNEDSQSLSFGDEHLLAPAFSNPIVQTMGQDQHQDQDEGAIRDQQQTNGMGSYSGGILYPAPAVTHIAALTGLDSALSMSSVLDHGSKANQPPNDHIMDKERAVETLVALTAQVVKRTSEHPGSYPRFIHPWSQAPSDLVTIFQINLRSSLEHAFTTAEAVLQHFVRLYSEHFHQLWPLLPRRILESGNMHPLLYLVLASIGAMYMDGSASEFGAFLHNAVRQRLVLPLELDAADESLVWLAQARLLSQVAALYFGQPRAFSYAQHLGALLAAQARKMCLFSNASHQLLQLKRMKGSASDASCLDLWLSIEERRRLAFGIFRGDTFTSVLLNSKPLLSLEEIALEFPTCSSVFNGGTDLNPRLALDIIEHHQTPNQDVRASDAFHVLLERNEMLPPLEPVAHEILLFGLQSHVWRFSYDRQLLKHFPTAVAADAGLGEMPLGETVASKWYAESDYPTKKRRRSTFTSEVDSLDNRSYQMADLVSEQQRLLAALAKWERALPLAKTLARNEEDRSYLLSSLLLYHLSLMRLYAPVEDIHQIHYRLADNQMVPHELVASVSTWTRSPEAHIAVKRVRSVWSLITQEASQGRSRSRFNFNAYVGLHHGAAISWAYYGASDSQEMDAPRSASSASGSLHLRQAESSSPTSPMHVDKAEGMSICHTFEGLFHAVSPARWSSFAEVARTLTTLVFPRGGGRVNNEV